MECEQFSSQKVLDRCILIFIWLVFLLVKYSYKDQITQKAVNLSICLAVGACASIDNNRRSLPVLLAPSARNGDGFGVVKTNRVLKLHVHFGLLGLI